ncbi:unnamed protein product [Arctogadus glacialis]
MHVSVSLSRIESCCWTSGASGSRWCVPRRGGRRRQEGPSSGSPWRGVMVQGCGRGCHVSISSLRRRLAFHRVRESRLEEHLAERGKADSTSGSSLQLPIAKVFHRLTPSLHHTIHNLLGKGTKTSHFRQRFLLPVS